MKTKEVKRTEAIARNAAWRALSNEQRTAELAKRPGMCARQLARGV